MSSEIDFYTPSEREFEKLVVNALLNFDESIDITKFLVEDDWEIDKLNELYDDILWNNPQIFYVSKASPTYVLTKEETAVMATDFAYGIKKEEYSERKAELDKVVAEAMKTVEGVNDPVEIAKRLHDYIVRICEYDRKARDEDDTTPLARTAYSVLVRHLAVCEGYTMAYRYLLREAGIRSEEVLSYEMMHCWNYVQIGGNWYHVDVTHDDPVFDGKDPKECPILHEYFLLSDEAMAAMKHSNWSVRGLPPASDKTYDLWDWDGPNISKFDDDYWHNYVLSYIRKYDKKEN